MILKLKKKHASVTYRKKYNIEKGIKWGKQNDI